MVYSNKDCIDDRVALQASRHPTISWQSDIFGTSKNPGLEKPRSFMLVSISHGKS